MLYLLVLSLIFSYGWIYFLKQHTAGWIILLFSLVSLLWDLAVVFIMLQELVRDRGTDLCFPFQINSVLPLVKSVSSRKRSCLGSAGFWAGRYLSSHFCLPLFKARFFNI